MAVDAILSGGMAEWRNVMNSLGREEARQVEDWGMRQVEQGKCRSHVAGTREVTATRRPLDSLGLHRLRTHSFPIVSRGAKPHT